MFKKTMYTLNFLIIVSYFLQHSCIYQVLHSSARQYLLDISTTNSEMIDNIVSFDAKPASPDTP